MNQVDELDAFVEQLCALELAPDQLHRDPVGSSWLPASLREQVESNPACARELAEFVAMELALQDAHEPSDPFFTRRVLDQLPEIQAIDDRRRTWILASAYALAIGVAYLLVGPLLSSGELVMLVGGYAEPVYGWYEDHALEAGGVWIAAALLLTAACLTLAPTGGTDRRRADA